MCPQFAKRLLTYLVKVTLMWELVMSLWNKLIQSTYFSWHLWSNEWGNLKDGFRTSSFLCLSFGKVLTCSHMIVSWSHLHCISLLLGQPGNRAATAKGPQFAQQFGVVSVLWFEPQAVLWSCVTFNVGTSGDNPMDSQALEQPEVEYQWQWVWLLLRRARPFLKMQRSLVGLCLWAYHLWFSNGHSQG